MFKYTNTWDYGPVHGSVKTNPTSCKNNKCINKYLSSSSRLYIKYQDRSDNSVRACFLQSETSSYFLLSGRALRHREFPEGRKTNRD